MPQVTVKLFATLQRYLPAGSRGRQALVQVPPGATVGDLLSGLGVPPNSAQVIMLNGEHRTRETPLADGDSLTVFPPVVGG